MLCAISGEAPQSPVASKKSGQVYERRLIEAYISENGKDPITGEDTDVDDLVELKTSRIVKPRPPAFTSIPSLLSAFQGEWDALALETFTLRQQLARTRQELSTALYQQDAAVRVIARLTKERDEARDALSKVSINASAGAAAGNGDAMQVDSKGLSDEIIAKIDDTQTKLSKTRRKRGVPEDWTTADEISSFKSLANATVKAKKSTFVSVSEDGELALVGGDKGLASEVSIESGKSVNEFKTQGGNVTAGTYWKSGPILATSSGTVNVYSGEEIVASFDAHSGAATSVALHASGEILASVGVDKSYVLYDLVDFKVLAQIYTESELTKAAFHPDGNLFAAGTSNGAIIVFDVKSGAIAATFEDSAGSGSITSLSFSENGTWLASASEGDTTVTIWSFRTSAAEKKIDIGSVVSSLAWDYSAQFLAVAGPGGITVQQYSKASKSWSEPFRTSDSASAIAWGPKAGSLIGLDKSGKVKIIGPEA